MKRSIFVIGCLLSALAWGDAPKFSSGGFLVGLQYGPGFWHLDGPGLASQVSPTSANTMTNMVQDTHTLSIELAYNILGHATIGAEITGTGWNVFDDRRGGAGFVAGTIGWSPLELLFLLLHKAERPIALELNTFVGFGYGIAGGNDVNGGAAVGMDGLVIQWGLDVDYYFTRYIGLGLFAKCNFMKYGNFYYDFDHRDLPGATVGLPNSSNGTFWHIGLTLRLRVGD